MAGKFEIKQAKDGQYMFNLKAGNGQVILTSELYRAKDSALNGIESVRKNAGDDARYERRENAKGEPYFILKAANHQEIGRSEYYSGKSAMENGIESVKTNAPEAAVVDTTVA
ncbi:YegP family protein [Chitinibacteraceae bacterium HSL-7]